MKKIRVMIADDHAVFRSGLRLLLSVEPDMEVVGEAADCAEALERLADCSPDVLLLDLTMPPGSGVPLIAQIRQEFPKVRVLVLTMHDDAALVRAALSSGANGYLVKTTADKELITAIRAVARGRTFVDLDLSAEQLGELLREPSSRGADREPGPLGRLSQREREVFLFVAQGLTNQEIAARLDVSVKTVETYRSRVGDKLGLRSRADFIRFAVEAGLIGPGKFPA